MGRALLQADLLGVCAQCPACTVLWHQADLHYIAAVCAMEHRPAPHGRALLQADLLGVCAQCPACVALWHQAGSCWQSGRAMCGPQVTSMWGWYCPMHIASSLHVYYAGNPLQELKYQECSAMWVSICYLRLGACSQHFAISHHADNH